MSQVGGGNAASFQDKPAKHKPAHLQGLQRLPGNQRMNEPSQELCLNQFFGDRQLCSGRL